MQAHIEGFRGPIDVRQFAGDSPIPRIWCSRPIHRYVLRRKPPGKLLPSAHAVDREYRVIVALTNTAVPVAKPYALCEDPAVIGTAFYVMDYVEGRLFWDAALPEVAGPKRRAIYDEMTTRDRRAALGGLRRRGLGRLRQARPLHRRQVARWTQQYRASETESIDAVERLIEWLPKHIPADEETAVVHGDFRLDNAIFHPDEPRFWRCWTGNCRPWVIPSSIWRISACAITSPRRVPRVSADWIRRRCRFRAKPSGVADYCRRRGRAPVAPQDWTYYLAFNMFRLAGILQGVLARAIQGNASSATALEAGRRARPLAEQAWGLVRRSFDV